MLGKGNYACASLGEAEHSDIKLQLLNLHYHTKRNHFDPNRVMERFVSKKLFHKIHLEDFRANCLDDYEVMKRSHSRLSLAFIRKFHIIAVLDQLEDNENVMHRGDWEAQYH